MSTGTWSWTYGTRAQDDSFLVPRHANTRHGMFQILRPATLHSVTNLTDTTFVNVDSLGDLLVPQTDNNNVMLHRPIAKVPWQPRRILRIQA